MKVVERNVLTRSIISLEIPLSILTPTKLSAIINIVQHNILLLQ